jgi:dipeptidyl aminopeptidase/acylaminoacyl peptidase
MPTLPRWEARFRAPVLSFPTWAADAPDRLVLASTESGRYQLHAWDRATGRRRQVTHDAVGVIDGQPTRDGTGVIWFRDETGAETGTWVVAPFDVPGDAAPLIDGLPVGWAEGLALGRRRTVAGLSTPEGYSIWVVEASAPARLLHEHRNPVRVAGAGAGSGALSADETVVCLEVMEDGDVNHPGLRIVDATTGATRAELRDPGDELSAYGFSPVTGDQRMAITHERSGDRRPAVWDTATGTVTDLALPYPGQAEPLAWWPDGSALLVRRLVEGRHQLHRYDIAGGRAEHLPTEPGNITGAAVRPDGSVWYRVHAGEHPARLLEVGSREPMLVANGPVAPRGRRFEPWFFTNPKGQVVHGFLVHPDGDGPHPVLVRVHGGPHSIDMDRWDPDLLAPVDAGMVVAMVNYRGSSGFGRAWRDALTGDPGFPELEDVLAGLDDLVARGIADPARVVLSGRSWGGYLALLGAGRHPERWVAAFAGVPVADYVTAYEDESPILQAMDRVLFGGSPADRPDLYRERNPLTYVDAVRGPLLIMAGEHDSRCPIRQVRIYVERLRARGVEPQVHIYGTGHASYDVTERIRQCALVLDFLARSVPGVRRLDGLDPLLDNLSRS